MNYGIQNRESMGIMNPNLEEEEKEMNGNFIAF